jgi:hypothetical protein
VSSPDVIAQRHADPRRQGPAVWASWQQLVAVPGRPGETTRRPAALVYQVQGADDAWRWPDNFSETWMDGTVRLFARVRAPIWRWMIQTRPAAELVTLRAALVEAHGEAAVAQIERAAAGVAA